MNGCLLRTMPNDDESIEHGESENNCEACLNECASNSIYTAKKDLEEAVYINIGPINVDFSTECSALRNFDNQSSKMELEEGL